MLCPRLEKKAPAGRDPIDGHRDQSYIRHVKPRSENQRVLMEAIETSALTSRPRPEAGTGKDPISPSLAL